jgi:hypothetical protein
VINTAAVNATLVWSIVLMSVAFVIGAGAAVWGFIGIAHDRRRRTAVPAPATVPVEHAHVRRLVHH